MHGFLQRIERDEADRRLHRLGERPRLPVFGEERRERRQDDVPQPGALGIEPILERPRVQREAIQQLTLVQGGGLRERRPAAEGDAAFECLHVGRHERGVERNRVADQLQRPGIPQLLPQREQRLTQPRPRLRRAHVAPEQRRELVALAGLAERQRQVGQERLRLPDRDGQDVPVDARSKSAEKREAQMGHRNRATLTRPAAASLRPTPRCLTGRLATQRNF